MQTALVWHFKLATGRSRSLVWTSALMSHCLVAIRGPLSVVRVNTSQVLRQAGNLMEPTFWEDDYFCYHQASSTLRISQEIIPLLINLFGQLCATCSFLLFASSWDKRVALPQWSGVWWLSLEHLEAQIGLCAEAIPVYLELMVQSSIQKGAAGLLLY